MIIAEHRLMFRYTKSLLNRLWNDLSKNDLERYLDQAKSHNDLETLERDYWRKRSRLVC